MHKKYHSKGNHNEISASLKFEEKDIEGRSIQKYIKKIARKAKATILKYLKREDLDADFYPALIDTQEAEPRVVGNEQANDLISNLIRLDKPVMVARFGSGEVNAMLRIERYKAMRRVDYIYEKLIVSGKGLYSEHNWDGLRLNAGFFSINKHSLERFLEEMLESCEQVDLLGSWTKPESRYKDRLSKAKITELKNLEPYFCEGSKPWTAELENKKVLVIHPYHKLIKSQYSNNRSKLFKNSKILPRFELTCIQAVQTIAGNPDERFKDWFEALLWMEDEAMEKEFDIALIGCGAYGFPLAARLKKRGKKAIHLGGALQLLFGIKGKRWDKRKEFCELYNESWRRPSQQDKPSGFKSIEGGCYW